MAVALADAPALLAGLREVLSAFQPEAEKASGDHFGEDDAEQLRAALGGIEAALEFSSGVSCLGNADRVDWATLADALETAEGLESLERMQEHKNPDVYEQSVRILERYFGMVEFDEAPIEGGLSASGGTGAEHGPVMADASAVEALAVALDRSGFDTTDTFGAPARDAASVARRSLDPGTKSAAKR
jgi:Atypical Arm repeat